MEGTHCFDPHWSRRRRHVAIGPGASRLAVAEYPHDEGCSITGGVRLSRQGAADALAGRVLLRRLLHRPSWASGWSAGFVITGTGSPRPSAAYCDQLVRRRYGEGCIRRTGSLRRATPTRRSCYLRWSSPGRRSAGRVASRIARSRWAGASTAQLRRAARASAAGSPAPAPASPAHRRARPRARRRSSSSSGCRAGSSPRRGCRGCPSRCATG